MGSNDTWLKVSQEVEFNMHVIQLESEVYHIVSEPGDATRYDFYILKLGEYIYCFSEIDDIAYPKRLHNVMDIEPSVDNRRFSDRVMRLARQHNVNVNTYNQVMKAIELCT